MRIIKGHVQRVRRQRGGVVLVELEQGVPQVRAIGLLGGIGTHPDDVMHMRRTAERLFGQDYYWSVLGAGRSQMPIAAMAASMGGNVRVGLEDSLWDGPGKLATSNAQQVQRIVSVLKSLNLEVATPDETRAMLQLRGREAVSF